MNSEHPPEITNTPDENSEEQIVPLAKESIEVTKQQYVKSQFHVERKTESKQVPINESLMSQYAEIKRVPIGEYINSPPEVREENGVKIIPIFEEHIEIIKKIYLKEEIRIESHHVINEFTSEETVRYQTISEKRIFTDE
ncbi:DUF2382 domain-containing protein [Rosenbergiella australiborealis]|nr:DUF2382 domain-containing protein [Rosenbergiella australiborealis]